MFARARHAAELQLRVSVVVVLHAKPRGAADSGRMRHGGILAWRSGSTSCSETIGIVWYYISLARTDRGAGWPIQFNLRIAFCTTYANSQESGLRNMAPSATHTFSLSLSLS